MPKPKVWEGNSCLAIERHERQWGSRDFPSKCDIQTAK